MNSYHFPVDQTDEDVRLDQYLTKHFPKKISRSSIKKLIDHGHVTLNEQRVKANHKVSAGDDIHVVVPENFHTQNYVAPEEIVLNIFYEDDHLIVVNKPSGLLVHPAQDIHSGTLVNALLNHAKSLSDINSNLRPGIVHRLDQETSGLLVVAKDNITHTKLAKQFKQHVVYKEYVAVVEGEVGFDEGLIDKPIGRHPKHRDKKAVVHTDDARDAVTRYRVLKRKEGKSLVALFPKTGRTHQLRVHMKYLGHPILGDDKYGQRRSFSRLALHARVLGFNHPVTRQRVTFSTPIPQQFKEAFV